MSVRYLSLPTAAVHRSRGAGRRRTHQSNPIARAGHLQNIYVGDLPRGGSLPQPLYNAQGALLLKAGETISGRFLSKLRAHGIYEVCVPQGDSPIGEQAVPALPADLGPIARRLDRLAENEGHIEQRPLIRNAKRPRLPLEQLRAEKERAATAYTQAVGQVGELTEDLLAGRCSSADGAQQLMSGFLEWIHLDADLVPALTQLEGSSDDYLYQHGLNVALMSMTVAAQLSVPQDQILHLGVGALIQDVGMLRVPRELRQAPRQLTEAERFEVARHPLHTLDCLEKVRGLSDLSLIVAYQIHERGDGSGYPRQRHRNTIHPLARLAAIADTYAAITAHRPHRTARGPYEAMEILLRETNRDRFDRQVMRSFLDCISLFPIGSQVRLSDGQFAKVLRANPGLHTKPVVVPLHDDGTESGSELDLSCAPDLTVIQALRDDHEPADPGENGTGGPDGPS